MRRIKVTFDLGGTWRLVSTVSISKTFTITKAKRDAIAALTDKLREEHPAVASLVQSAFAEELAA